MTPEVLCMRFLPQWEPCPAPGHKLEEPEHSSGYQWVWDSMTDRPAYLLNLACLVLVQRENAAPWSSWRACASLQLLFGFASLYIPVRNTGNKILSRASAQLNISLHCLWIKTNRNYLSPDGLFLYLLASFLMLIWFKSWELFPRNSCVCLCIMY